MSGGHQCCWARGFLRWPHCALWTCCHFSIWLHSRPRSESKFMIREENKKNIYINSIMQLLKKTEKKILWTEYMWAHNPNREQRWNAGKSQKWWRSPSAEETNTHACMHTHVHTRTHTYKTHHAYSQMTWAFWRCLPNNDASQIPIVSNTRMWSLIEKASNPNIS